MNSTKQHAYPRYDEICNILEYGAHIGKTFPVSFCQNLLEQLETCAQKVQALQPRNQMMELLLIEIVAHLRLQPHFSKEARQSLIERAERILSHDPNVTGTTSRPEAAE